MAVVRLVLHNTTPPPPPVEALASTHEVLLVHICRTNNVPLLEHVGPSGNRPVARRHRSSCTVPRLLHRRPLCGLCMPWPPMVARYLRPAKRARPTSTEVMVVVVMVVVMVVVATQEVHK